MPRMPVLLRGIVVSSPELLACQAHTRRGLSEIIRPLPSTGRYHLLNTIRNAPAEAASTALVHY